MNKLLHENRIFILNLVFMHEMKFPYMRNSMPSMKMIFACVKIRILHEKLPRMIFFAPEMFMGYWAVNYCIPCMELSFIKHKRQNLHSFWWKYHFKHSIDMGTLRRGKRYSLIIYATFIIPSVQFKI